VKKFSLNNLLKQISNTPVFVFHGYGTGKLFEDEMIDRFLKPSTNIKFWRNSKIAVPGRHISPDYPFDFENIEVDAEVHREVRATKTRRAGTQRTGYEFKYQSCSGSAEDKVVASAHRLALLIRARKLDRGYIVVGGDAWTALPLAFASKVHAKVQVISEKQFAQMAAARAL